jgi:hypothetical protein
VVRVSTPVHPGIATLVTDLTLGGASTAEEYQFSWALVFPGRRGTVFVSDMVPAVGPGTGGVRTTVRQYDSTGRFVRAVGRAGQGPGEYSGPVRDVKELTDGRILLSTSQGILVYSPSGEPLGRWPARWARAIPAGATILVDPAGFVYTFGERRQPGPSAAGVGPMPFLYRFRLDGTLVDTIAVPESSVPDTRIRLGLTTMPFSRPHVAAWSPLGYFVTAFSPDYEVDLRLPRPGAQGTERAGTAWRPGDPVTSIRHSVPSVPVQAAEGSDWRRSITMYNGNLRVLPNWQWTAPDVPRVKPPIRDLLVDGTGRIWIRLSQPARLNPGVTLPARREEASIVDAMYRWIEPYVFDLFEPSGRYLGRVGFPDEISQDKGTPGQFSVHGDFVWAMVLDQNDVPVVKRYRIRWAG